MAFGNTPDALALSLGLELTARKGKQIDEQAASQLTRNNLADDVGGGAEPEDIARMRGEKTSDGYTGTVPKVLACGGFRAKALVPSHCDDEEEADSMGDRFLGLGYDPRHDDIIIKIVPFIRMSVKRSKQRRADVEPITTELLEDL